MQFLEHWSLPSWIQGGQREGASHWQDGPLTFKPRALNSRAFQEGKLRLRAVVTLSISVSPRLVLSAELSMTRTGCEGRSSFIVSRCIAQGFLPVGACSNWRRGQPPQPTAQGAQPSPQGLLLLAPPSKVLPRRLWEHPRSWGWRVRIGGGGWSAAPSAGSTTGTETGHTPGEETTPHTGEQAWDEHPQPPSVPTASQDCPGLLEAQRPLLLSLPHLPHRLGYSPGNQILWWT